ncbi:thiol reductant ABC exporter subunit CydC [Granulicoccus sp. GXG6511]|uniref:thiol reductant ABC exporter subunit CydC n=1 Tax=Granulicoccus sp. GXG6511 TaxID=3381351 RepID=UPI003D7EDC77
MSRTDVAAEQQRSPFTLARDLMPEVPRSRTLFWVSLFLQFMTSLTAVTLMGASAWLLSRAAEHPPVLYLMVIIVIVRACGLFRAVFRYAERITSHTLALRMQSLLRIRTYARLAATTLLGRRRGDLLVRVVKDVEAIQDLIVRVALPFASAGLIALVASTAMAVLSPIAGIALFASAVVAGVVVPRLAQLASRRADAATVPARGELADRVREINRASYDLAAYGDSARTDALLAVDDRLRVAEERASVVRGLAAGVQVLAAGFAVLVALAVGVPAVADGDLNRVALGTLVLVPLALHEVLSTLTQAAQTYTRATAGLARVAQVLEAPALGRGDRAAGAEASVPRIELSGADVGWPGAAPVLTGVSLQVREGERVALVGPSGVGKTTIAATLMGLIPPMGGAVRVDGTIGYLAQDAHIFNTSVAENVKIGNKDATEAELADALLRSGLRMDPNRIVGEEGAMLSGGEARRVALARVLLGNHQCWILDEPTEHLDAETADALMADIWAVSAGDPVLVITHDPRVIERCDRVVKLG